MARGGDRQHGRVTRGQLRGRGGSRPQRGAGTTRVRDEFKTSRVQEIEDISETTDSPQEDHQPDHTDIEDSLSASEDEDVVSRQPYSTLLQTLLAGRAQDEPAPKRRKVESTAANEHSKEPINRKTGQLEESVLHNDNKNNTDAALAEGVEEENENLPNETDDEGSDTEDVTGQDPFVRHFVDIEERQLKEERGEKHAKNTVLGDGLRKQSIYFGSNETSALSVKNVKELYLKARLSEAGSNLFRASSSDEKDLLGEIFNYRDVQYSQRTLSNAVRLRDIVCLHALNHVFKTRDRVLKNNAKLSQYEGSETLDLRDQGFTRPKVLFIVPTKQACVRFVESVIKVSEPDQQENKSRFWETFSAEDDEVWQNKPDDFRELFGGNHEEDFRVGLKFTRKTIKYFAGFYNSDIIFGSALGLMRTITTGGGGKDRQKRHDADFLSSIEVVVVDHGAAIQMQNFQHLEYVFTQLNQLPKDSHGCDFARVRHWYLDGNAKNLRQTIILSAYPTPELNSLFTKHTYNTTGLTKYTPIYAGSMLSLPSSLSASTVPQTFLRFESPTPKADSDARFKFFTVTILPSLLRHKTKGVLIFVPTYFDFVRVRNHLSTSNEAASLSFGSVSEYTSVRDTARARSHFASGRHGVMVYSERAHHYFRYRIRGVKRVVFYGVPENPVFWGEVVGSLGLNENGAVLEAGGQQSGAKGVVRALFSRWDVLKLERIVGTERVGRLVNERGGDTFEFV